MFQEVSTVAEGFNCLDDNPHIISAYIPLQMNEGAIALRDAIYTQGSLNINGALSTKTATALKSQFNSADHSMVVPVQPQMLSAESPCIQELENQEMKPEHVRRFLEQVSLENAYRLALNGGVSLAAKKTGKSFDVRCGRRDILVSQFILQSGNNYQIDPEYHSDSSDLTVCVYLEGKGLKYKDERGNIYYNKTSGPIAYMHRGGYHLDVVEGRAKAPHHAGFVYADGEKRANMSIGLCNPLLVNSLIF